MPMNVNAMVDLEIIFCQYTSQHTYLCFYRALTFDFLMARFGNSKSYVKFFEGSNVAECPTFEIKLFTLTVHNLSICYVISHISSEGNRRIWCNNSSRTFLIIYFQKQHIKCHIFLHLKSDLH